MDDDNSYFNDQIDRQDRRLFTTEVPNGFREQEQLAIMTVPEK